MEDLMRDEELCQACEDRKLDMLAYEEKWAKMMGEVRKTDTPQDFRDGVAIKSLREDRRGRDRQRLVTRAVRMNAKIERARRQRKHTNCRRISSLHKLHQAGLRADMDELKSSSIALM